MSFTLRWGIIGCGNISSVFTTDLITNPALRGETQVKHQVVGVAARAISRAQAFVDNVVKDPTAKAHGSYESLLADPDVDCVYIGTTNPEHFAPAKMALEYGKHVLCEKPFTVTMAHTDALIALAKEKNLFLMEAVWTRFQLLTREIERIVREDKVIGDVRRVYADLSFNSGLEDLPADSRMISPASAGGGLLDLGPYPMLWALLMCSGPTAKPPSRVASNIQFTNLPQIESQVDKTSTWVMNWDDEGSQAICSTSLATDSSPIAITIQGSKGEITIPHPAFRPSSYTVNIPKGTISDINGDPKLPELDSKTVKADIPGRGMHWMADEVAKSIRDGKTQHERMTWEMTRLGMSITHLVRKQNGFMLPMDEGEA